MNVFLVLCAVLGSLCLISAVGPPACNENDVSCHHDPEEYMNVFEIIRYHGYPAEQYDVTTKDGYILRIQRIPYGKSGNGTKPRTPVIVQHGFLCSSAAWVVNTPDKNLAYLLADAGYDVWLTNIRGNTYGRKHVRLSPKQPEFWQFSFDEIAEYDMPALIDFILEKTGFSQCMYVGHSMGTSIIMAMLSSKKEYNSKVKAVMLMAPAATLTNMTSPIRYLLPFVDDLDFIYKLLGEKGELLPNDRVLKFFSSTLCTWSTRFICANLIFLLCGFDRPQLNETRLPVYTHHTPAGASVNTFLQIVQIIKAKKFQHFDYGKEGNMKKYGQITPPPYNVSEITAPTAVFWSENDSLADPSDVADLIQKLKNVIATYRVPYPPFDHTDFMWAIDVKKLLYSRVIQILGKMGH